MISLIITVLCVAGLFFTLLGIFITVQIIKPSKPPTDASNIFNRGRLVWFAATRQHLFIDTFPWLKNDELDNTKGIK